MGKVFYRKNFDGTGMLVHQAAKSFKHWFNYEPDVVNVLHEIERFRMNEFRRFVAGAICPNCKKKDTIALSADDKEFFA